MKLIALLITNNVATYGGAQPLRQVVLFVWLGNPIEYKGNTFVWQQGRKLTSGTLNGNSFTYNYDGNGMRYEKTVNGTTTSYYWNGDQLLMESKNEKRTWYIYGVTGIEGMIVEDGYNGGTYYYFDKNTLGDIVAIREASGTVLATYEYDAWGNCKVMDAYGRVNTSSSFIGNINPFRYRGYYYDTETGFYYLQTRYYDPTICRFINADNYALVAELSCVAGQLNMFAYCNNNPIMYTDESGEIATWMVALIVIGAGAIIGGAFNGVKSYNEGNRGCDVVLDVAIGAGYGMAAAGFAMSLGSVGYIGFIGTSASAVQFGAIGFAGFNLGNFIWGALLGVDAPEPIEMPTKPVPPIYSTPITGF